jgi:hypothetical protein
VQLPPLLLLVFIESQFEFSSHLNFLDVITVRDFSGVVRDIDLCAFHSFVQVSDFIMHPSCLSELSCVTTKKSCFLVVDLNYTSAISNKLCMMIRSRSSHLTT